VAIAPLLPSGGLDHVSDTRIHTNMYPEF